MKEGSFVFYQLAFTLLVSSSILFLGTLLEQDYSGFQCRLKKSGSVGLLQDFQGQTRTLEISILVGGQSNYQIPSLPSVRLDYTDCIS